MQWFRLYAEFANDLKVQMMSEANQRRLVMLFCMCSSNEKETFQDAEAIIFLRISDAEWQATKEIFLDKDFIGNANETQMKREKTFQNLFQIKNWNKRQYQSDSSTERVRKHRENKKRLGNVSVTSPETETESETEKKERKKEAQAPKIEKPEDVSESVWEDFKTHRKTKKAAITETVIQGFRREAEKAGISLELAMRETQILGWQGFRADWYLKSKGNGNETTGGRGTNGNSGTGYPKQQTKHQRLEAVIRSERERLNQPEG